MRGLAVLYCLFISKITALPITQLSGLEGPSPLDNQVDDDESFVDVLHINEDNKNATDITNDIITDLLNENLLPNEITSTTNDDFYDTSDSPFKTSIGFGIPEDLTPELKKTTDINVPNYTTEDIQAGLSTESDDKTTEAVDKTTETVNEATESNTKTSSLKEEEDLNNSQEETSIEEDNSKGVSSSESSSSSSDESSKESGSNSEDDDDCVPSNCDGVSPVYVSFDLKEVQTTADTLDGSTIQEFENRFGDFTSSGKEVASVTTENEFPSSTDDTSTISGFENRFGDITSSNKELSSATTENEFLTSTDDTTKENLSTTEGFGEMTTDSKGVTSVTTKKEFQSSNLIVADDTTKEYLSTTEGFENRFGDVTSSNKEVASVTTQTEFTSSTDDITKDNLSTTEGFGEMTTNNKELTSVTTEKEVQLSNLVVADDTTNQDLFTTEGFGETTTNTKEVPSYTPSTTEIPTSTFLIDDQKLVDITTYRPTVKNVEIIVGSDPPTTFVPTTDYLEKIQTLKSRFGNDLPSRNEVNVEVSSIPTTAGVQFTEASLPLVHSSAPEARTEEEQGVGLVNNDVSFGSIFSKFANRNFGYKPVEEKENKQTSSVVEKSGETKEEVEIKAIEPAVFNGVFSFGNGFGRNNYASPSSTTTKPGSFGSIFNNISKKYRSPYKYSWSFSSTTKPQPDDSEKQLFRKSFIDRLTSTTESFIELDTINLGNTGSIQRFMLPVVSTNNNLHVYKPLVGEYL